MFILKKISHILIALLLASTAGGMVWYYVRLNTPSVPVVTVKAGRISTGTVIGREHVELTDYPAALVPADAERSLQNVLGKTIVSGTVFQGEVIREGHMQADTGSLRALLDAVAPGREAIDLPAETSGGLQGVAVGDRVNVYTEYAMVNGNEAVTAVDCAAREAIIIKVPSIGGGRDDPPANPVKGSYVIAITPEEEKRVAEGIVRSKKFTMVLLSEGGPQ